jgi:hypothetical protein
VTNKEAQAIRQRLDENYPGSYEDTVCGDMKDDLEALLAEVQRLRMQLHTCWRILAAVPGPELASAIRRVLDDATSARPAASGE